MKDIQEQHLVVDWSKSINQLIMQNEIENAGLCLTNKIEVPRLKDRRDVITKFYNVDHVFDHERGVTDFTIYLVTAPPFYGLSNKRQVNIKLFNLKKTLRKKTKSPIHATDNIQETKDNLMCLGLYDKHYNRREFQDLSEAINVLNKARLSTSYQFEYYITENTIIDDNTKCSVINLKTTNYYIAKCLLDGSSIACNSDRFEYGGFCTLNNVLINGEEITFNLNCFDN